ncbi:CehA/McbA family metallohydrolase, partial [candidate division KSB1 bacterium]|nr:CehA/McbA family metallohydrolase [candidate division KSB1 bacterium]
MTNELPHILPLFALYAEIHYLFRFYPFSLYFKKQPEVLADAPHRIEPGTPIPILCLIKDSHRYPIHIKSITIKIIYPDGGTEENRIYLKLDIYQPYWWKILFHQPPAGFYGKLKIDVTFEIKIKGKTHIFKNDNYRGTSHLPLEVFVAPDPLPREPGWVYGDLHYHSNYTEDHVEFGAPIGATKILAGAMGLNFFAVTDHSYDLDDRVDNYLKNDPTLPKWRKLSEEIHRENQNGGERNKVIVIQGEEATVGDKGNRNLHLLVLNNKKYIPGSGDSAEKWFLTRPTLSLQQALDGLEDGALAFAAHPEIEPPFLQKLLVRRVKWTAQNYAHPNLTGLQVLSGRMDKAFWRGIKRWVRLLLRGEKCYIVAGNDAHGNFNRFRQIKLPMVKMWEHQDFLFGKMRTGVFMGENLNHENLMSAIKKGRLIITSGPFLNLTVRNQRGMQAPIGNTIPGKEFSVQLSARSTEEFGRIVEVKVLLGDLKTKRESILKILTGPPDYRAEWNFPLRSQSPAYIRAELRTECDG